MWNPKWVIFNNRSFWAFAPTTEHIFGAWNLAYFFTDEKLLSVYCTSLMNLHNCLMYTTVACNNHDVPFLVPASHITFTRFMVHQERSMYDFVCFDFLYLLRQFWLAEGMVSCPWKPAPVILKPRLFWGPGSNQAAVTSERKQVKRN